jgi:hypothetical protein
LTVSPVELSTVMPLRSASSAKLMVMIGSTDKTKRRERERHSMTP